MSIDVDVRSRRMMIICSASGILRLRIFLVPAARLLLVLHYVAELARGSHAGNREKHA
jgi:hypothetical protein